MKSKDIEHIRPNTKALFSSITGREWLETGYFGEFFRKKSVDLTEDEANQFWNLLGERYGRPDGNLFLPEWLCEVFCKLVPDEGIDSICDPWPGLGFLISIIQSCRFTQNAFAYSIDTEKANLGKIFAPKVQWKNEDFLPTLEDPLRKFDLVVSNLPIGARPAKTLTVKSQSGPIEIKGDLGYQLLVGSCLKLTESGMGVFIVGPTFFQSDKSPLKHFSKLGLSVSAALEIPTGTFAPYTSVSTYLIIVRRGSSDTSFFARLSESKDTIDQVIKNWKSNEEGGTPELGAIVRTQDFHSINRLLLQRQIEEKEKLLGLPLYPLNKLATTINLGRNTKDFSFEPCSNSIYIPLVGDTPVLLSQDELSMKDQNYAQVVIDHKKSNARFVAAFLNSDFGRRIRDQFKSGSVIPRQNKKTIGLLQVFVPEFKNQKSVLAVESSLQRAENTILSIKNELDECRRGLWEKPHEITSIQDRVDNLSKQLTGELNAHTDESLEGWMESLPFPLSSILRAWRATSPHDFKTKYETLLHFFEATAEFLSIVLISAFMRSEESFHPIREELQGELKKNRLSYAKASFGTWQTVYGNLAKKTRSIISGGGKDSDAKGKDICSQWFNDLSFAEIISKKEITRILGDNNTYRNNWKGHVGIVGVKEAERRNNILLSEVEKLRGAFEGVWDKSILVNPKHMVMKNKVFENEVSILMGSHSDFITDTIQMAEPLDSQNLYILHKENRMAFQLIPLVRVGPTPSSVNNACYFYNRLDPKGPRFISYHYPGEPELPGEFKRAAEAIKYLGDF